jgi:hypothetical protein
MASEVAQQYGDERKRLISQKLRDISERGVDVSGDRVESDDTSKGRREEALA